MFWLFLKFCNGPFNSLHLCLSVCAEEDSGSEEETLLYYTPAELGYRSRKKKRSKIQPKTSQSLFSIVLSINHGLVAVHTQIKVLHKYLTDSVLVLRYLLWFKHYWAAYRKSGCKRCFKRLLFKQINNKVMILFIAYICSDSRYIQQDDKSVLENKHGEFWMEVKNGTLFGVTQHEGYKDQHYVCFHTSQACLYHHGLWSVCSFSVSLMLTYSDSCPHYCYFYVDRNICLCGYALDPRSKIA